MTRIAVLSRAFPGRPIARVSYPYAPPVTEVIKAIPGRVFHNDYKVWTFPLTPANVLQLRTGLQRLSPPWGLEIPRDIADELNAAYHKQKAAEAVRVAGDADVDFDFKTEPYAHQRAGLAFLQHLEGGALLWEMGLGKTKTAIDFAEWLFQNGHPDLRVLVICPNTVKRNWGNEIEKHADHQDWLLPKGTLKQRAAELATARYTIINAEALSYPVMAKALREIEWDLVIVDESTRFKSPGADRTKNLRKLRAKRRVILTGTPITGKPQDAYAQFEWLAPGTFGNSYHAFKERYCQKEYFGTTVVYNGVNPLYADELADRIAAHSYRILKADVLDLPEKVYVDRTVELGGEQLRAYNQMRDELRIEIEGRDDLQANTVLTMILRLTQVTAGMIGEKGNYTWLDKGNAKLEELDNLLNDELAGEPVVIFGLYQEELEQLARRYTSRWFAGPTGTPIIYGPTPEGDRARLVDAFQAGDLSILFCQIRTGGIGINLTAAKTAIYYTRGWGLEEYLQSQDRLHRIGQTGTVSIIHLLAGGTIDNDIAAALAAKRNLADHLTGDAARQLAATMLK